MQQLQTSNVLMSFGHVVVNNINHTSGIFIGENYQFGWSAHFKANHGIGEVLGYLNNAVVSVVAIYDNDFIDTPINDNDTIVGHAVDTGMPVPVVAPGPPGMPVSPY